MLQREWQEARAAFEKIKKDSASSPYLEESLYWLGYSLNKLSSSSENFEKQLSLQIEALSQLEVLMQRFPSSKWIAEAKLLRLEIAEELVKKGLEEYKKYIVNGASKDADIDLKIVALDALLQMDKDKAFPTLEKIIRQNKDPRLREKAIFILSQIDDPRIIPLFEDAALKDADREIREKAVFWLGQIRTSRSRQALVKIYHSTDREQLKDRLIFSLCQHDSDEAVKELIAIYKKEKSLALKKKIIFWLGQSKSEEAAKFIKEILLNR